MATCIRIALLILLGAIVGACGPDTIFLRPALDTPAQHVKNGHNLLERGKIDAAHTEFARAKSLDDTYAPAYVGIALVRGHRGDIDGGVEILNRASALAATPDERNAVDKGYGQLERMRSTIFN